MLMTSDRARASRARRRAASVGFEGLEGRTLPSRFVLPPIATGSNPQLRIDAPRYVSQQAGGFDVTIARDNATSAGSPLTVNFTAAISAGLPDAPVDSFTPVKEPVTFPAGVTSKTVHVPVSPGATNPGSVPIALTVETTTPGYVAFANLDLVSSPSAVPPTAPAITGAHLIVNGSTALAIAITFSGPMDPASVEHVHAYAVNTWRNETYYDYFGLSSFKAETLRPVAIAAAHYNPATYTVTLIPKKPLKTTGVYTIRSPIHLTAVDTLTDPSGTALAMTSPIGSAPGPVKLSTSVLSWMANIGPVGSSHAGTFQFTLRGNQPLRWAAPKPNVTGGS
jgi:hypothetical protein